MISFSVEPTLYCFYFLFIYTISDATMFDFTAINVLDNKKSKWQLEPIIIDFLLYAFR